MKYILALVLMTLILIASTRTPANAADRVSIREIGDQLTGNLYKSLGTAYEEIRKNLTDYSATCGNQTSTIYDSGAAEIAELATHSQLNADEFAHIYNATCNFGFSEQVALEVFSHKADYRAFILTYNRSATCGSSTDFIMGGGALSIARRVATGQAQLEQFLQTFDSTCSASIAETVATESASKQMDYAAFKKLNNLAAICGDQSTTIFAARAMELARMAARGELNLSAFVANFRRTCDPSYETNASR